jgi:hypothetical protein
MNCKWLMILVIAVAMCAHSQTQSSSQPAAQAGASSPQPQNTQTQGVPANGNGPAAQPGATQMPKKNANTNPGAQTTPAAPTQAQRAEEERGSSALPESDIENGAINDVSNLRDEIQGALAHEPTLENSQINVGVKGSDIELTGTVPNGKARETARRIAESYAINERVIDHMKVAKKQ